MLSEGGLGWWRDTEYATETPKFIMGGVALDFVAWANGPGAGKERDWNNPTGHYGIAQLSPNLLWPPDGLNLKQGVSGELFGYGYLPLPLTEAKSTTAGADVPTGGNCWTLFLNTANFKGPATFFLPYFWSEPSVHDPAMAGMFLDSCPSMHDRHFSIETQHIPWAQAEDSTGVLYGRMAPTLIPSGRDDGSVMLHRVTSYSKKALWDRVKQWLAGGDPVDGAIDPAAAHVHPFDGTGSPGWAIWLDDEDNQKRNKIAVDEIIPPELPCKESFRFACDSDLMTSADTGGGALMTLPQYYRLEKVASEETGTWVAIDPAEVPPELGLADVSFSEPQGRTPLTYVTPEKPESCWKMPGPVAGPFEARPGDGSVITYHWYRFADQPSMLNADMTDAERESPQQRVEMLHQNWDKNQEYLAPPSAGSLAALDPALIVTPPEGLEIGYVPIATRQGPKGE